jgi:Zn-dependent protease
VTSPLDLLRSDPLLFVLLMAALLESLALHEFSHAMAADLLGDRLPRASGRLTLNPIKHLDPIGTLCIVVAGFGWAKPVEFRPQALASKRFGSALVALAGPMMNVLLALVAGFALSRSGYELITFGDGTILGPSVGFDLFLLNFFLINSALAIFNLLPLPPLDGSRLLTIFLPPAKQKIVFWLDRYGFLVLLLLVFLLGPTLLFPLVDAFAGAIGAIVGI